MSRALLILLLLVPSVALAQARPDTRRLTCAQARGLVLSQGAVVLGTGDYTYDRYVSSVNACVRPQVIEPAWIGTADVRLCNVGYVCRDRALRFGQ